MESNKSRNRHERNFSNDFDYDVSLSDYNTIQSLNKSSKYKNYVNTIHSTNPYLTKTITNSFLKKKTKMNINLPNYHSNYLHQKIKSNEQFQKIILTEKNIDSNNKIMSPMTTFYSKSTQVNTTLTPFQDIKNLIYSPKKISRNRKINIFKNNTDKIFSRTQSVFPTLRAEKLCEFKEKINKEIKGKYILYHKKDYCDQLNQKLQNKIDQYKQNIRMINTTDKLYYSYTKTYDNYEKKLYNILNFEREMNENYKIIITQLKSDILRLKYRMKRLLIYLQENFQNKCFLLSVKNSTRLVEKFSSKDLEELKYDNLIMSYHLKENNINNNENNNNKSNNENKNSKKNISSINKQSNSLKKKNKIIRTATILSYLTSPKKNVYGRKMSIYSMGKLIESERPFHKNQKNIFNDPQDFINHLDSITSNISQSLYVYNNIRSEINILKHELYNVKNNKSLENYLKILKNDILNAEKKLLDYKSKNEDLISTVNNLQILNDKADSSLIKVQEKIHNMFMNFNIFFKVYYNINEMTDLQILKMFEKYLNNLIKQVKEDQIKFPNEYNKMIKEIEKRKKDDQTRLLIIKQKDDLNKKINKVIEKNKKLIVKPRRKVEKNIHLINKLTYNNNQKVINKENTINYFEY